MAIEIRKVSQGEPVGMQLTSNVVFSGAGYAENPNVIGHALPEASEVTAVRFQRGDKIVEYPGVLGRTITTVLHPVYREDARSKEKNQLKRALADPSIKRLVGVEYTDNTLLIPSNTEVTIEKTTAVKINEKRDPRIYQSVSTLVPHQGDEEILLRNLRIEYDRYLREGHESDLVYSPAFAYESRSVGGVASDNQAIREVFDSLYEVDETRKPKLELIYNRLIRGTKTVGILRSYAIEDLIYLGMGPSAALYLKVAFAPCQTDKDN